MATIHLLIGIPGSGKSTYARKLSKEKNIEIVSTDLMRQKHPDWKEEMIWPAVYERCAVVLMSHQDVIFDATNITPKVRKRFVDNINLYYHSDEPYQIGAYYFDINPQICQNRVIKRNEDCNELYLPPEVPLSYAEKVIPPSFEENFVFIKTITLDKETSIIKK